MVLLANGGADVPRARGPGGGSIASAADGADVGGRCLRTRYNRNIRSAAVVVGQRSLVPNAANGLRLLLLLRQRIRLKSRLVSGIPRHYQRQASFERLRTKFDDLRTKFDKFKGSRDACSGMFAAASFGLPGNLATRRRTRFPCGSHGLFP